LNRANISGSEDDFTSYILDWSFMLI